MRLAIWLVLVTFVIAMAALASGCASSLKPVTHSEAEYAALKAENDRLKSLPAHYDRTLRIDTWNHSDSMNAPESLWKRATEEIPVVGKFIGTTGSAVSSVTTAAAELGKSVPVSVSVKP